MRHQCGHWTVEGPLPCAVYTQRTKGAEWRSRLMILERVWQEPLFALGPDSRSPPKASTPSRSSANTGCAAKASASARHATCGRSACVPSRTCEEAGRMLLDRLYWEHL
jgi:hypothetical protein